MQVVPKCKNGRNALQVCRSYGCQKDPFICVDEPNCRECKNNHKKCQKVAWFQIVYELEAKFYEGKQISKTAQQLETLFYDIKSHIKKAKKEFNKWKNSFALTLKQQQFYSLIQANNFDKIDSKQVYDIIKEIERTKRLKRNLEQEMKSQLDYIIQKTQVLFKEISEIYKHGNVLAMQATITGRVKNKEKRVKEGDIHQKEVEKEISREMQEPKIEIQTQETKIQIQAEISILMDSNITKANNIAVFFKPRRIKSLKLLYRGSTQSFSAVEFHKRCDQKGPTVVLIKTEFDNVIGGYAAVSWEGYAKDAYGILKRSSDRSSFLFSVTNNEKLSIVGHQNSQIRCSLSYGPIFGAGDDLFIATNANNKSGSYSKIGKTYNNGTYTYEDQQSSRRWSGQTRGHNFIIKEWEVFSIDFE